MSGLKIPVVTRVGETDQILGRWVKRDTLQIDYVTASADVSHFQTNATASDLYGKIGALLAGEPS
jgi:hypothetical protein